MYRSQWVYSLRQDAHESWNNFVSDNVVSIMQVSKAVMKDQIRFSYLNLWLRGDLWFEFFLRLRRGNREVDYTCLIENHFPTRRSKKPGMAHSHSDRNNRDSDMLTNDSQSSNHSEGATSRFNGVCDIWLKPLYFINGEWIEMSGSARKTPIISLIHQGKRSSILDSLAVRVRDHQTIGDMVKGCPQVISNVTDSKTPLMNYALVECSAEDISRMLRINFYSDGLGIRTEKLTNLTLEYIQMLMRPLSLENGTFKWIHNHC